MENQSEEGVIVDDRQSTVDGGGVRVCDVILFFFCLNQQVEVDRSPKESIFRVY